jgi:hypothetical protein
MKMTQMGAIGPEKRERCRGMPANQQPAEFYRREADRLRTMTDSPIFFDVRSGLLDMVEGYEAMAEQSAIVRAHKFGQPFGRSRQHA